MRIKAYVLAADPAWIEASVLSYYDIVEEIIVSYDENRMSWTGTPIAVDQCLARLKAIDKDNKMRLMPGHYARLEHKPMENDTYQRQCALDAIGDTADWVLQFDTDEYMPQIASLLSLLREAEMHHIYAVEWPMRVLYQWSKKQGFLEICSTEKADRFEYPGPVAVRPGVRLKDARRAEGAFIRPVVQGDTSSLQIVRQSEPNEMRLPLQNGTDAILHNSWARSPASIRSKIAGWSHNEGLKSWLYYYFRWRPAPYTWRIMRDFHPFARGLWPALKVCEQLDKSLLLQKYAHPF